METEHKKSKISNVEWGLVIGALFMIDVIQLILDFFLVWEWVNWLIDVFIQAALAFYLYMRGERLGDSKRLITMALGFFFDQISLGALPMWVLEGVSLMLISKIQDGSLAETVSKVASKAAPIARIVSKAALLAGPEGEAVSLVLKRAATAADKVTQAAGAVQNNALKRSGQKIQNNVIYHDFRNVGQDSGDQRLSNSPRLDQLKQAAAATRSNEVKKTTRQEQLQNPSGPSNIIQAKFRRESDDGQQQKAA